CGTNTRPAEVPDDNPASAWGEAGQGIPRLCLGRVVTTAFVVRHRQDDVVVRRQLSSRGWSGVAVDEGDRRESAIRDQSVLRRLGGDEAGGLASIYICAVR